MQKKKKQDRFNHTVLLRGCTLRGIPKWGPRNPKVLRLGGLRWVPKEDSQKGALVGVPKWDPLGNLKWGPKVGSHTHCSHPNSVLAKWCPKVGSQSGVPERGPTAVSKLGPLGVPKWGLLGESGASSQSGVPKWSRFGKSKVGFCNGAPNCCSGKMRAILGRNGRQNERTWVLQSERWVPTLMCHCSPMH